jgi:hypothetical protein
MNTATAARIADGVTAAYLRDLTRHPAPPARDDPNHRRERVHASAPTARGRRRGQPGRDRSPAEIAVAPC